jgi:hypothetical protein
VFFCVAEREKSGFKKQIGLSAGLGFIINPKHLFLTTPKKRDA